MRTPRRLLWMVLILLVASLLRLHDLPQIPPGMTHDEADHGLDAWGVVQGERPLYFTVGYGREPLYDYSTAILMSFLGPSYLAGRLTSVLFSLILIAAAYSWTRRALDGRTALLAAAGLALGFWPLMTSRQALRSETLAAILTVAMVFFWEGMMREEKFEIGDRRLAVSRWLRSDSLFLYLPAGLFLGLTFYTYLPARILWLLVPCAALYCIVVGRSAPWRGVLVTLGIAAVVGLPLFLFLLSNPDAEARIGQLAQPLQQAAQGNMALLWANVRSGLGIFTLAGDDAWRYNIAGRPLLSPAAGALFYAGVLYAIWRVARCAWLPQRWSEHRPHGCRRETGLFVALLWLGLGLAPVLATGPSLSTTQAIGLQPVLYLFPALILTVATRHLEPWLADRMGGRGHLLMVGGAVLLGAVMAASSWRAYFLTWAQQPDVAVQYEAELVSIVRQLNDAGDSVSGPVAISTDAPGRFHDAATAQLFLENEAVSLRWFDGRHSLLLPAQDTPLLVFGAASPLNPALAPYLQALGAQTVSQGPTPTTVALTHSPEQLLQLYPQFSTEINRLSTELSTEIMFGDVVRFLAFELQTPHAAPGDSLRLATVWQVRQAPLQDLVFFTHLSADDNPPVAQADRLDVPTHTWRTGDVIIQLHTLAVPADLAPGAYTLKTGIYDAEDWQSRLPVRIDGAPGGDALPLVTVVVEP